MDWTPPRNEGNTMFKTRSEEESAEAQLCPGCNMVASEYCRCSA